MLAKYLRFIVLVSFTCFFGSEAFIKNFVTNKLMKYSLIDSKKIMYD